MPDLISPVQPLAPVSQPYGLPSPPGNGHPGIDLAIPVGTPLLAAAAGTCITEGLLDPNGYGNLIEMDWGDGYSGYYAHCSEIDVIAGQSVAQGQQIGLSGGEAGAPGAGNSTGPHLHYEVRIGGATTDPAPYLAVWAPAPAPAPIIVTNPKELPDMFYIQAGTKDVASFWFTDPVAKVLVHVGYDEMLFSVTGPNGSRQMPLVLLNADAFADYKKQIGK